MASPNSTTSLHDETNANGVTETNESLSQKRAARDSSIGRPPKRRANKACLSCRNRKVRCDVVNRGQPCTNCRLDGVDCAVKESNRGRKPGSICQHRAAVNNQVTGERANTDLRPLPLRVELSPADILSPPAQPAGDNGNSRTVPLQFEAPDAQSSCPPPMPSACNGDVDMDISPRDVSQHNIRMVPNGMQNNLSPISDSWLPQRATQSPRAPPSNSLPRLPHYIRPVPPYLRQRDLQYLADSGALTIPDDAFRDELLRTYVYVVYPFMPTIDLDDFLGAIKNDDGGNPVSLLLFQAIMFAGVTFVDAKFLKARGYDSRKSARKAFFSRVRLLYGLDYEQDRLPLLQAVLLMTYWYDCPNNDKDTWYWMGIALSLAQVSSYHREPLMPSHKQRRLRRRIWWSCVIRDRLLALGVRRPSRIYNEDFRVEPLTIDDFDLRMPPDSVVKLLGESRFASSDPAARAQTAALCVELSKLCSHLGRILHTQYSLTGGRETRSDYLRKAVVVPKQSNTQLEDLAMCDADLDLWIANQDIRAKYSPPRTPRESRTAEDDATRVIQLHQAQLHMIYLTTITVLHKPQVFLSGQDKPENGLDNAQRRTSKAKIMDAAVAITNLAHSLKANDQLRYLSTSSVPAFLSASLIHLMDTRSPDDDVRSISIGRFCQCVGALQQLQDIYSSADYAIYFLRDVLKNANIDVPMVRLALMSPTTNETNHHQQRTSRSTSDCPSASTRICTPPYQNQSISQNQQPIYADLPLGRDTNNYANSGISSQTQNFLDGQFDPISTADFLGGAPESCDIIFDPLVMNSWLDIDVTVPSMSEFDVDGNSAAMNATSFM